MPRIVQKYGGTSVGDVERIKKVAERVKATRDEGHELVIVVSARSGVTNELLARAKAGATLIVKFDAAWAGFLKDKSILSEPVSQWGGVQGRGWNGNGWGYLDHFIGGQAVPSKNIISTNAWEASSIPNCFWAFSGTHKHTVYGAYVARPQGDKGDEGTHPTLLVLLGAIDYGKGKIILAPSYPVDANHAFNDLLFYNLIIKAAKCEW